MKFWLFLLILFLIPLVQAENYNSYSNIKFNYNIDTSFKLTSSSPVDLDLTLNNIPLTETGQQLVSLKVNTIPESKYELKDSKLYISWKSATTNDFKININAVVLTTNNLVQVNSKVNFPLEEVHNEYTEPTEHIDINSDIRKKAQELAKNKDDLYDIVFTVGSWVKSNIKYEQNTLTSSTVQKSSWVYENRQGVCDEFTNLFISMLRSLNIQARYISGMAYTNIEDKLVPHAWAEVYFTGYGWVPFDVTFGQLGWVDPTHIKAQITSDSGKPSITYRWEGQGSNLENQVLDVNANIISLGNQISSPVSFQLRPAVNKLGEDSYVPIEVRAANTHGFYIPEMFTITKAPTKVNDNVQYLLLKPQESKDIYWIIKGPEKLDQGYVYTTTVGLKDIFGSLTESNITFSQGYTSYSEAEANTFLNYVTTNSSSNFVSLDCFLNDYYFIYEDINVNCSIKNNLNKRLTDLFVCVNVECNSLVLNPNEEKVLAIKLKPRSSGLNQFIIEATHAAYKVSDKLTTLILENPDLKIEGIDIPNLINYNEKVDLSFVLVVKAPVKDVQIYVGNSKLFSIDNLDSSKKLVISSTGKDLIKQSSRNLRITYSDMNNRKYELNKTVDTTVTNVPFLIKLLLVLHLI